MGSELAINFEPGGSGGSGGSKVALKGDITEAADFAQISSRQLDSLVINLAGVKRINSTGVREWIEFLRALEQKGTVCILEACSTAIVSQLNMISNFAGHAEVRSVMAPYMCPECDETSGFELPVEGLAEKIDEPRKCPSCGAAMEFDDLPDVYLAFTRR